MKLSQFSILFVIILFAINGCTENSTKPTPPRELTAYEKSVVESSNEFGLELFKQVVQSRADENICISPFSASMALGMTFNGARNATRDAMATTLGYAGLDLNEVNVAAHDLINLLEGLDPDVTFDIANSIWYDQFFPISQTFSDMNRTYYKAVVEPADFDNPATVDVINSWVSDNTNSKIDGIIEPPIDPLTVMFLINASYFLADWQYRFDPESTIRINFNNGQDPLPECLLMNQGAEFECSVGSGISAVKLPYGNGLFSMLVMTPNDDTGIDDFIAGLSSQNLNDLLGNLHLQDIQVGLPKFKMEFGDKFNDELTAMGMAVAFEPYQADFRGMVTDTTYNPELFISKVKQKTYIKVDEQGTEAAAVTVVEVSYTGVSPLFIFDKPFVFMIMENHSNTILFIGKVFQPEWQE
jgi:serpin B